MSTITSVCMWKRSSVDNYVYSLCVYLGLLLQGSANGRNFDILIFGQTFLNQ